MTGKALWAAMARTRHGRGLDRERGGSPTPTLSAPPISTSAPTATGRRHRDYRSTHRDPLEILDELRGIETEILGEIDELAEAVREAVSE